MSTGKHHLVDIWREDEIKPFLSLVGAFVRSDELMGKGISEIRVYNIDNQSDEVEEFMEKLISHESTHLAIFTATGDIGAVRALDRLESWGHYPVSCAEY